MKDSTTDAHQPAARSNHFTSLSVMMFLQYAVWGVWLPYLANYLTGAAEKGGLGFTGSQVGWILGLAGSAGAITAPFLAGQIADRFINAERWLGILLIVGGAIKFLTANVTDYSTFLWLSIAYSIAYMPTLSLTNSIAFAHLPAPEKQFPPVRTLGTIGWIVASNAFPLIWLMKDHAGTWLPPFVTGVDREDSMGRIVDCLRVSGVISVLYGVWAFVGLPKTPPKRVAEHPLAFLRAFGLFARPDLMVLTLAALLISMIHQVYFIRTGVFISGLGFQQAHVGPIMSIGQFAEIAVLAVLGIFLKRLGYKPVLIIGCLAFALRYAWFAFLTPATGNMILAAMVLHGVCYGFFFAGAYLYVDKVAPKDVRHSAQTVFGIIILGIGPVLAGLYNEWLSSRYTPQSVEPNWKGLWLVQAGIGIAAMALVAVFFRSRESRLQESKNPVD